MKQIFRNLKNDNKNKAMTHKIFVESQCGKNYGRRRAQSIHYMTRESTKRSQLLIRYNSRSTISLI